MNFLEEGWDQRHTRVSHDSSHQTSRPGPGAGGKATDTSLATMGKSPLTPKLAVCDTVGIEENSAYQGWEHSPWWNDPYHALTLCTEKRHWMPFPQTVHFCLVRQLWKQPTQRRAWPMWDHEKAGGHQVWLNSALVLPGVAKRLEGDPWPPFENSLK